MSRSRHSKRTAASRSDGAATQWLSIMARPASANSSQSGGISALLRFIASAIACATVCTTQPPPCNKLTRVSLSRRSRRLTWLKASTGGAMLATVKNENGARLGTPRASQVLIQAIGRGSTLPLARR